MQAHTKTKTCTLNTLFDSLFDETLANYPDIVTSWTLYCSVRRLVISFISGYFLVFAKVLSFAKRLYFNPVFIDADTLYIQNIS